MENKKRNQILRGCGYFVGRNLGEFISPDGETCYIQAAKRYSEWAYHPSRNGHGGALESSHEYLVVSKSFAFVIDEQGQLITSRVRDGIYGGSRWHRAKARMGRAIKEAKKHLPS